VDKESFKNEMLQVLRAIKQRYRRTMNKQIDKDVEEENEDNDGEQDKDVTKSDKEKESDYSESNSEY